MFLRQYLSEKNNTMAGRRYIKQEVPPEFKKMLAFIGGLLREYRWEEALTQKEVQEQSGIHHRTISRIENGDPISLVSLFRYMRFLNLDMQEIAFTYEEIE